MFGFIKRILMGSVVLSSLAFTTNLNRKNEDECSSCILYIVLFSIFFTISIGLYFVYYKYMNRNKENVSKYDCLSSSKFNIKWE